MLAAVVAALAAATGGVWAAGGFQIVAIPYPGFGYGQAVVAGDVTVTVKDVALTDGIPGQERDPAHDYLDVAATLRWHGDRGVFANGVAAVLRAGLLPGARDIGTSTRVIDADGNPLRTINPGMDYKVIAYWPIPEDQHVRVVGLSVVQTLARDQEASRPAEPLPRAGDLVRVDLFEPEDLR